MTAIPRRGRAGFTLTELILVVVVIALLAVIALPNLRRALVKARATAVVGELHTVRVAVLSYLGDHHEYPPDETLGVVPSDLEDYLPEGFSFVGEGYVIDYDEWADWRGFVSVGIVTQDRELGLAVLDQLGGNGWTDGNLVFSLLIEWTG